ncbi:MAG: hypothetical protein A4E38_00430 [Methanoregulaceae archaeon PtaB.Bin108]|nr:MAG: hypothetical protein A4E38_00430 [Methanoregulaceae archaeon PtaB.Bin108]
MDIVWVTPPPHDFIDAYVSIFSGPGVSSGKRVNDGVSSADIFDTYPKSVDFPLHVGEGVGFGEGVLTGVTRGVCGLVVAVTSGSGVSPGMDGRLRSGGCPVMIGLTTTATMTIAARATRRMMRSRFSIVECWKAVDIRT